jgi:phospholipid transport system substrate-binding protein
VYAGRPGQGAPQKNGDIKGMARVCNTARLPLFARGPFRPRGVAGCLGAVVSLIGFAFAPAPAQAADPAVKFMAQVGRELVAAARTRSPGVMSAVIQRYGDVSYIGLFSLGAYRSQLSATEKTTYYGGMVKFIGRYAATEAPKYQVAKVEWSDETVPSAGGVMVDSRITLTDGSAYDVRWLLTRYGGSYRVRDAMVLGLWMTPFLKKLFEDYIAQNGGNPRALVAALNR